MRGDYNSKMNKIIEMSSFNDDFCDCLITGYDEPGTSACLNSIFACENAPVEPFLVYGSMINDGVCDCCDGSDEYLGYIKCTNTCYNKLLTSATQRLSQIELLLNVILLILTQNRTMK